MEDRVEKEEDDSFQQGAQRKPDGEGGMEQRPKGGARVSQATSGGLFL